MRVSAKLMRHDYIRQWRLAGIGRSIGFYHQSSRCHDTFIISSFNEVIESWKDKAHVCFYAFSLDIRNLFYSLPHKRLLQCRNDASDNLGRVGFQNEVGPTANKLSRPFQALFLFDVRYLRLLNILAEKRRLYRLLSRTFLCDVFIAHYVRISCPRLEHSVVAIVFSYVGNYLVFLVRENECWASARSATCSDFRKSLKSLDI